MIKLNNVSFKYNIDPKFVASLIPNDTIVQYANNTLGINIADIVSRGSYNIVVNEDSFVIRPGTVIKQETDSIYGKEKINLLFNIAIPDIGYVNNYDIKTEITISTDLKDIEVSGILYIPTEIIGDIVQSIVDTYVSTTYICKDYGKCDPCIYNCSTIDKQCQWYDLVCHGQQIFERTSCSGLEAECKLKNASCYTNELACDTLKKTVSNIGSTVTNFVNTSQYLCQMDIYPPYTCLIKKGVIEYQFSYSYGKKVGSILIKPIDLISVTNSIQQQCGTKQGGTYMNIGPLYIGDSILEAKVCYSRYTKKFTGPILIVSKSTSYDGNLIFYGNIETEHNGVLIYNAEFQLPSNYTNYLLWLNQLENINVESIFINEDLIKLLKLQPILGKNVLDLIESKLI